MWETISYIIIIINSVLTACPQLTLTSSVWTVINTEKITQVYIIYFYEVRP